MRGRAPVLSCFLLLLLSGVLVTPLSAAAPPEAAEARPEGVAPATGAATATSHFLPLIMNQHRSPRPCPLSSPFSLQIAALHQVKPGLMAADQAGSMTEAEWLAWYDEAFPTLVDALMDSGACWTRLRIDWNLIQPEPPPAPYIWGPYHDEKLALVAQSGVHISGVVDNAPLWAARSGVGPLYPEHLGDLAQFLTDLVNRYKQPPYNIHHWELFNEPDLTSKDGTWGWGMFGEEYVLMVTVARGAIKAADPQATVLMGGMAYDWFTEYDGPFNRYFPDDVMAAGGSSALDALNVHYFPDYAAEWERWNYSLIPPTCGWLEDGAGTPYQATGIDLVAKVTHFRNRMDECFNVRLPIWVTELGEHGYMADPATLEQQARYVIQGHARALAAGVHNVTWFAIVSPPYDPFEQGLLDSTFAPKPAFYSYQTLTRELRGHTYSHALAVPGVEGYVLVDGAGKSKIVAWAWGEPLQPAYITIPLSSKVRRVDRNGSVTYVLDGGTGDADGTVNGSIVIQLPAPPLDPVPDDSYRYTAEPLFLSP